MALCGIGGVNSTIEGIDFRFLNKNLPTLLVKPAIRVPVTGSFRRKCISMRCRASMSTLFEQNDQMGGSSSGEDELGMVMSDFEVADSVSIGLGGRVSFFLA